MYYKKAEELKFAGSRVLRLSWLRGISKRDQWLLREEIDKLGLSIGRASPAITDVYWSVLNRLTVPN